MKKIFILILATLFIFGSFGSSFAMPDMFTVGGHKAEATQEKSKESGPEAVEVGNKFCPISGKKIDEGEAIKYEHEGKIYNLCCKACVKDFKKDPKKYIEKLKATEKKSPAHEGHQGHSH